VVQRLAEAVETDRLDMELEVGRALRGIGAGESAELRRAPCERAGAKQGVLQAIEILP